MPFYIPGFVRVLTCLSSFIVSPKCVTTGEKGQGIVESHTKMNSIVKRKLHFNEDILKNPTSSSLFNQLEEIHHTTSSPFKVTVETTTNNESLVPTVQLNIEKNSTNVSKSQDLPSSASVTMIDLLNKINRTVLNSWYEIKSISDRIDNLETKFNNTITKVHCNSDFIEHESLQNSKFEKNLTCLPLKTEENLHTFEQNLLDHNFKKQMVSELSRLMRNSLASTVRAILRYLFHDILLQKYSFKGQKKKRIFSTLTSCSIIFDAVKKIAKYKNYNDIDVEQAIKVFIAGAKFSVKPTSTNEETIV